MVPSLGRPSLDTQLASLAAQSTDPQGWAPAEVVVVDDRRDAGPSLAPQVDVETGWQPRVVASGGRGPAAARNLGW